MRIYHGSDKIIQQPLADFRNTSNDYGRGFYTTQEIELAKEWACKRNTDGFVNAYELDTDGLVIHNLEQADYPVLNWVALLTRYRGYWQKHSVAEEAKDYLQEHFLPDLSDADVVIGYRADDSYFAMVQDFIGNSISLQQLGQALHLGKLGRQIVVKSETAFTRLEYQGNEYAPAVQYYAKKVSRDLESRRGYALIKKGVAVDTGKRSPLVERVSHVEDIYMLDILRGKVKDDDLRV